MNKQVFSVFDAVARRYLRPFFADSIEEAIRSFRAICNEPDHHFHLHKTDFTLFHVGSFDFETGMIVGHEPHSIAMAAQMIALVGEQLDLESQLERKA